MTGKPLITLVKIGESHPELLADLKSYGPRARAGRLRNLALAGLLLQRHHGPDPQSTPLATPITPHPPPPHPSPADKAETRARTKDALRRSLGDDD